MRMRVVKKHRQPKSKKLRVKPMEIVLTKILFELVPGRAMHGSA